MCLSMTFLYEWLQLFAKKICNAAAIFDVALTCALRYNWFWEEGKARLEAKWDAKISKFRGGI